MKNEYEAMFIYQTTDSVYKSSLSKTKEIFSSKEVEIIKEEDLGVKKLAYEVKKNKEGHYYLFKFKAKGEMIKEIKKELKLSETILRHLFIRLNYKKKRRFK